MSTRLFFIFASNFYFTADSLFKGYLWFYKFNLYFISVGKLTLYDFKMLVS
mgnify:CR=1 FL=1